MSMMRALALMGSGAEGFVKGQRDEEAAQRARDQDTFQKTQQQFTLGEQQRVMQQRAEMATAANEPATAQSVQPTPVATPQPAAGPSVPDENAPQQEFGNPMQALASGTQPAGQPGAAPAGLAVPSGLMQAAVGPKPVAPAVDPEEAQTQRQIAVMRKYDPVGAMAMQAHALTAKSAKMDMAAKMFDNDLNTAASTGWNSLIDFTNKSGASPSQHRYVPSPDGKTGEVMTVLPDGSMQPTGMVFQNNQSGALQAAAMLSQGTSIQAKSAHLLAQQAETRKSAHDQVMETAGSRRSDALDERNRVLDDYYMGRNENGADAIAAKDAALAAKNPLAKMPEADKATLLDLNKQLELINSERVKARVVGMWQPDSPGAMAIQKDEAKLLMQRQMLLAPYKDGTTPTASDPLGLRAGSKIAPATQAARDADRPAILQAEFEKATTPEDRAAIQREIDRLPKSAKPTLKAPVRLAVAPPAVAPLEVGATAPDVDEIPPPPPQFRQSGISQAPNPAYIAWRKAYGAAWDAKQQQQESAATAGADVAKKAYNPYMQNAVR